MNYPVMFVEVTLLTVNALAAITANDMVIKLLNAYAAGFMSCVILVALSRQKEGDK